MIFEDPKIAYACVVLIFAIVFMAACYAIKKLESKPVRVAAVIVALGTLIGALVPVVDKLLPAPPAPPAPAVSPAPAAPQQIPAEKAAAP